MNERAEANQIYDEIHAVIKRATSEYDQLSCFAIIGALEAVKADVLDMLEKHNEK